MFLSLTAHHTKRKSLASMYVENKEQQYKGKRKQKLKAFKRAKKQ